jgi:peptide/nickel transport system permease protein
MKSLLIRILGVALGVGLLSFALLQSLPGDAAYRIAASRYGYDMVNTAAAEAVRAELGLDRPLWQQLLAWLGDVAQGNLGVSLVSGEPVLAELSHQWGHTLALSLLAWGLALLLGVGGGLATAVWQKPWLDRLVGRLAVSLRAIPAFVLALLLATLLAEHLGWLPVAGHGDASHYVLPALTLALALAPGLAQVTRHSVAQVLASAYVQFARTKGLPARWVLLRHVLRNAAVPITAFAATQLVLLVEGMVVVETFFAWPGIGHALVHAILARDVPMVQGTALCMGLLFVLLNAGVDAVCTWLDPRSRA